MSEKPLISHDELRVLYVQAIQENTRLFARVRVLEEALAARTAELENLSRRILANELQHWSRHTLGEALKELAKGYRAALAPTKTEGTE